MLWSDVRASMQITRSYSVILFSLEGERVGRQVVFRPNYSLPLSDALRIGPADGGRAGAARAGEADEKTRTPRHVGRSVGRSVSRPDFLQLRLKFLGGGGGGKRLECNKFKKGSRIQTVKPLLHHGAEARSALCREARRDDRLPAAYSAMSDVSRTSLPIMPAMPQVQGTAALPSPAACLSFPAPLRLRRPESTHLIRMANLESGLGLPRTDCGTGSESSSADRFA